MMPNTSVRPAASRNSSRPNCNPFKNCSTTSSMEALKVSELCRMGRAKRNPSAVSTPNEGDGFRFALPILRKSSGCKTRADRTTAARAPPPSGGDPRSLHRTFVVEAILVVLDDGGHRLQRERAVGILHHILQIKILDRDVVVAVFERAAQRGETRFLHRSLHGVLLGGVAAGCYHGAVDQLRRVVGLGAVIGRAQVRILLAVIGDEFLVLLVRQIIDPFLRPGNAERVFLL